MAKLNETIAELQQTLGSAMDRIAALESELAELKENHGSATTKVASNTTRPGVFYKVLMVPKTGIQPQGRMLAKVLSEIPVDQLVDGDLIPHAAALAAVEANFNRFKSVQTPRRMLNYYSNELAKKAMLAIVEK